MELRRTHLDGANYLSAAFRHWGTQIGELLSLLVEYCPYARFSLGLKYLIQDRKRTL
jgi:hypothetical protein